ncbi:hypothetical protein ABK040_006148 [Willaertia magna]
MMNEKPSQQQSLQQSSQEKETSQHQQRNEQQQQQQLPSKLIYFDIGGVLASDVHNIFLENLLLNKISTQDYDLIFDAANNAWASFELGTITEKEFWKLTIEHGKMLNWVDLILQQTTPVNNKPDLSNKNKNTNKEINKEENIIKVQDEIELKDKLSDHLAQELRKCEKIKLHIPTIQMANKLKQNYNFTNIGILSNHCKEWSHHLFTEKNDGILSKTFTNQSLVNWSWKAKTAKPHLPFYEYLFKRLNKFVNPNIEPKDICFVDDKEENLVTARNLGWTTIQYNNEHQRTMITTKQLEEKLVKFLNVGLKRIIK